MLTKTYRSALTRLRISAHNLRIETGRYGRQRIERNDRICQCCVSGDLEDEYHFILICPAFKELQSQYIKKYYYTRPSMFKFIELLRTTNKQILIKLSKYIILASNARNSLLSNYN